MTSVRDFYDIYDMTTMRVVYRDAVDTSHDTSATDGSDDEINMFEDATFHNRDNRPYSNEYEEYEIDSDFLDQEPIQSRNIQSSKPLLKVEKCVVDQDDPCSICMSMLKKGDNICKIGCNHMYHTECISTWYIKKPTCPLCRSKIS